MRYHVSTDSLACVVYACLAVVVNVAQILLPLSTCIPYRESVLFGTTKSVLFGTTKSVFFLAPPWSRINVGLYDAGDATKCAAPSLVSYVLFLLCMFLSVPPACLASTACFVVYRCVYTCFTHIFLACSHLHGSLFFNVYMWVQFVYLSVNVNCVFCCVSLCIYLFYPYISCPFSSSRVIVLQCVYGSSTCTVYLFVSTKCMFCCVSIFDCVSVSASISLHRQSSRHSSPSPSHDVALRVSGLEVDGELRSGPMLRPDVPSSASTVATSVHCCTS